MEPEMINPNYQDLYVYELVDSEDEYHIVISHPDSFNPKSLSIKLNSDIVRIDIPGEIPIVYGKLFAPVSNYSFITEKNKFTVVFHKKENKQWPIFIIGPDGDEDNIDPQSALNLYLLNSETKDDEIFKRALRMLFFSAFKGFLPAIIILIEIHSGEKGDKEILKQLLSIAAYRYSYGPAYFSLGLIYMQDPKTVIEGFKCMKSAAERNVESAVVIMANILSPLSDIEFPYKDAKQALELYESIIAVKEEPSSLYGAAKLYNAGLGCKKDVEKAKAYYERAKKIANNVPNLNFSSVNIPKIVGIGVTAAFFGYFIFRIFRKKD